MLYTGEYTTIFTPPGSQMENENDYNLANIKIFFENFMTL